MLSGDVQSIRNQYRKSLYNVSFEGSRVAFANALGHQVELIEVSETEGLSNATIRVVDELSPNRIISNLIQGVEVKSFSFAADCKGLSDKVEMLL